jgi:phosphopantetheinyl transferase (holo-ACP synthase)
MEVFRKESGEPVTLLHDKGLKLLETRGGSAVLISLSHTVQHATAVAVLEKT